MWKMSLLSQVKPAKQQATKKLMRKYSLNSVE